MQIEQDRQRAERNLADTEYLAREIVALRMAVTDVSDEVVTRDVLRAELRTLLEQLDARDAAERRGRRRTMTAATADAVRRAVGAVVDPELRRPIGELDMVRDISVAGGVALGRHRPHDRRLPRGRPHLARMCALPRHPSRASTDVALEVGVMSPDERRALTERLRGGRAAREMPFGPGSLTRVIAVTSGKGGVGKSTRHREPRRRPRRARSRRSGSSTPTCTASRSPGCSDWSTRTATCRSPPASTT